MPAHDLLTTAQVAEILHMKQDSIARKINRGEIPAVKVGKRWLIRRDTLDAIVQPSMAQGT
jgi:excisionase family DNA binding protein